MPPRREEDKENFYSQTQVAELIKELIPSIARELKGLTETKEGENGGTHRNTLDYAKLAGHYDGVGDGRNFIITAESLFVTLDVNDKHKVPCFCATLTGKAAKWLLFKPELRQLPWTSFKPEFDREFTDTDISKSDLMKFINLKRSGDIKTHVARCRELIRGTPQGIPERELILMFINTLSPRERPIIATLKPATLEDAFERALHFDSFTNEHEPAAEDRGRVLLTRPTHPKLSIEAEQTRTCFNCGRPGHIARNCRAPPKRYSEMGPTNYRSRDRPQEYSRRNITRRNFGQQQSRYGPEACARFNNLAEVIGTHTLESPSIVRESVEDEDAGQQKYPFPRPSQ